VFSFPRLSSSRGKRFLILSIASLCLLVFAPCIQAQQLSVPGLQAPAEKKSAKQELPSRIRAARGEAPLGRLYDNLKVEPSKIRRLPALEAREIEKEVTGKRVRIGTVRSFELPLKVSADSALYRVAEGEVRVMGVVSEGALYTRVHFSSMALPAGARVFVYSLKNPEEFYGPYEGHGLSEDGTFWTPPMEGDGAVIEYFSPAGTIDSQAAPFQVSEISHIYRNLFTKAGSEDEAGACNLNVTNDWLEVAKSVGYLEFTSGAAEYACTGTLLNNQANDQTPYLLTANHCFDTQTEAQTLRVYWNYNTGDSPPASTPFTDGANLLATGTSSDFTFVRLTGSLPGGLFFSGWDATPTSLGTSVTGIHHPDASHKRISFGATNSTCSGGLPGPCSNFTNVRWTSGTTEEGSSGSGIWKGSGVGAQLVGTLTGGLASCSNLSGVDHYGSFSATYPNISSFLAGGSADLSITKNTASNLVAPGAKAVYYITVTNNLGATVNPVSVTDNLPPGLTYSTCQVYDIPGGCNVTGNNLTITFLNLAAGKSATAVISATVNSSVAKDTVISNTATVSSSTPDPNMSNNASTATFVVNPTSLKPKANGKIAFGSDRAFSNSTQPSGIYTINANGAAESLLFNIEPFASAPVWSPDGTKIAYGKRNSGTYGDEIYVANADGTGSVKVAGNVFNGNRRITWSPDGLKLAYMGEGSVYIVNADGTGRSRVPNIPVFNDLSWSPDGTKFAYTDGSDIWATTLDGTQRWNLTQNYPSINGEKGRSILPRWSPDGTRIIFAVETNNYKNIFVVNAEGGGVAPLITLHQSTQPAWSPDGTKVTFIALNSLYVANADGTGATPITNNGFYNFNPDWQPLAGGTPTLQLSANSYSIGETGGSAQVVVTRTETTTAATVNYATSDTSGLNACNSVTGLASSRCDYATSIGTLRFAAGESSKTIYIPIIDDNISDGTETFTLTLSNPSGASLGSTTVATVTITDNANGVGNPIDGADFFIREHYIDFLGREPEPSGLAGWLDVYNNCGRTIAQPCDRIEISSAFFRSSEFQDRASFIYRFYSAVGKIPLYEGFMPDFAKVSGFLSAQELEANKVAFVNEFMARSDYQSMYGSIGSNDAYVTALLNTLGLPTHANKQAWINSLNGGASRAAVLRAVTEDGQVSQKYYNEAFVIMQYFGYLRRSADLSYLQWIQTMNSNGGDYREMINGFLNSAEYRNRFQ
jgi:fimbrial isopeptide formation D2 family protein